MDKNFLEKDIDTRERLIKYGELVDEYHSLIYTFRGFQIKQLSQKVWIYPTNSLSRLFFIVDAIKIGRHIIKKNNINLIIAHDPIYTGTPSLILSKLFGIKLLLSIYGTNIFDPMWIKSSFKNRFLYYFGKMVFYGADAIQTDSQAIVNELARRYNIKVFWKPLVPAYINNFKTTRDIRDDRKINILFIARLVEQKNIPFLVDVIEKILTKKTLNEQVAFTIVGYGKMSQYLNERIKEKHLSENVTIVDGCEQNKLIDFYKKADIFILTSYYEGFPRVFMEAAAIGVPVVTTKVSGAEELVGNGRGGYVIDHGDLNDFSNKLELLIKDGELRATMSNHISEYFWAHYNSNMTINRQIEIFDYFRN